MMKLNCSFLQGLVATLLMLTSSSRAYSILGSQPSSPLQSAQQQQQQQQQQSAISPSTTRRDWLSSTVTAATAFGLTATSPHAAYAAKSLTTFDDPQHGFSLQVPSDWTLTTQELNDRRCIKVWTCPSNPKLGIFIAYTPVRDDFTSLSSFGSVDQVAAQTILPKGSFTTGNDDVQAEMLSAVSSRQAYIFDYTQEVRGIQPNTHFRTIFALQQGATGGAGAVLVTITLQAPEAEYSSVKGLYDSIINSYGKNK